MVKRWQFLDQYTEHHSRRVGRYVALLGQALKLAEQDLEALICCAQIHDIGKAMISVEILQKPGRLTEKEFELIKEHPVIGAEIAQRSQMRPEIVEGIRYHHERYDGRGYPAGLKGEAIPLFARIITVADAYDAMTSARIYRPALSPEAALRELENCSGTQFDPRFVEVFLAVARENVVNFAGCPERPVYDLVRRLYPTPMDLLNAIREREPSFFQCCTCGMSFVDPSLLERHAKSLGHLAYYQVVNIHGSLFKKPLAYVVGGQPAPVESEEVRR
ncbi:MAG: HD-GYP domain-containing protein [Bacillota bacterium]|nr:HD-GYP domain-containing protein [Bacillota bacterium]